MVTYCQDLSFSVTNIVAIMEYNKLQNHSVHYRDRDCHHATLPCYDLQKLNRRPDIVN